MMQTYELIPKHDSASSFYGKARVEETDDKKILFSYNTKVAEIDKKRNIPTVYGTYSATTLRHIKEFLMQNGFPAETKKQIEEMYINHN